MEPDKTNSAEIVERYGVSRRTIRRKIERGELTPVYKGTAKTGAYVFDAAEVAKVFAPKAA